MLLRGAKAGQSGSEMSPKQAGLKQIQAFLPVINCQTPIFFFLNLPNRGTSLANRIMTFF
jgi:hypothetical protein